MRLGVPFGEVLLDKPRSWFEVEGSGAFRPGLPNGLLESLPLFCSREFLGGLLPGILLGLAPELLIGLFLDLLLRDGLPLIKYAE